MPRPSHRPPFATTLAALAVLTAAALGAPPASAQPRLPTELFFHGPGWTSGSPVRCMDAVPAPPGNTISSIGILGSVTFETDRTSGPAIPGGCIFLPDLPALLPKGNVEIYLFATTTGGRPVEAKLEVVNPVTGAFQVGETVRQPAQLRWNRFVIRNPVPVTVPRGGFLRVSLSSASNNVRLDLDLVRPATTNLRGPQGLDGIVIRPDDRDGGDDLTPSERDCRLATRPAATLLFPYFEVNLADPQALTTLFAIENAGSSCTLARVTLWTDLGVPTLTFYVFLAPNDVQPVNLRDVFAGNLPDTSGVLGNPQCPILAFQPCTNQELAPTLSQRDLNSLRADHLGRPNPLTGDCAGTSRGNDVAVGYVTVDTVHRCGYPPTASAWTRAEWQAPGGYFVATDTSNENALLGDWFLVDTANDFAQGESAVHVVADPARFGPGDYTFYGRYVSFDGSDARAPLSGVWDTRYLTGGLLSGGTDLLVWRDTRSPNVRPVSCGSRPPWGRLGQRALRLWDEDGLPFAAPLGLPFPDATQRVSAGSPGFILGPASGRLELDLWHDATTPAQAWVGPVLSAAGRFSLGFDAARRDDLCEVAP